MKEFVKIPAESIRVGSCFSEPVYFEDGINMFLPSNRMAKQYHLDVLRKWHISYLLTKGVALQNPIEEIDSLELLDEL